MFIVVFSIGMFGVHQEVHAQHLAPDQNDDVFQPQYCTTTSTGTGQITGKITSAITGQPLINVYIRLYGGSSSSGFITTDAHGSYTVTQLMGGVYKLAANPVAITTVNYAREWFGEAPSYSQAASINVVDGQTTGNINIALDAGATLSGVVTAQDTALPLQYVWVRAIAVDNSSSYDSYAERTDSQGRYVIENLPATNYKVLFDPHSYSLPNPSRDYVKEYHNNQRTLVLANPVAVTAATTVTLDAQLARGAVISGTVRSRDTGLPIKGASVFVWSNRDGEVSESVQTDVSGVYSVTVPTGGYNIRFSGPYKSHYISEYYSGTVNFSQRQPVTVTAPQILGGIDASLVTGGLIIGWVTDALTGAGLENTQISIYDVTQGFYMAGADIDASGYYTSSSGLSTAKYKLQFQKYRYLDAYYVDAATIDKATEMTVTAPSITPNINVALRPCSSLNQSVYLPLLQR